jgi:hypothetical protein
MSPQKKTPRKQGQQRIPAALDGASPTSPSYASYQVMEWLAELQGHPLSEASRASHQVMMWLHEQQGQQPDHAGPRVPMLHVQRIEADVSRHQQNKRNRMGSYSRPDISERKSKHDTIILRTEYVLDLLLPPSRASDAVLDLEEVYDRRWLPNYGLRAAQLIFASQAAGLIWSFHGQRLTKWLGGALGLIKLTVGFQALAEASALAPAW